MHRPRMRNTFKFQCILARRTGPVNAPSRLRLWLSSAENPLRLATGARPPSAVRAALSREIQMRHTHGIGEKTAFLTIGGPRYHIAISFAATVPQSNPDRTHKCIRRDAVIAKHVLPTPPARTVVDTRRRRCLA